MIDPHTRPKPGNTTGPCSAPRTIGAMTRIRKRAGAVIEWVAGRVYDLGVFLFEVAQKVDGNWEWTTINNDGTWGSDDEKPQPDGGVTYDAASPAEEPS